MDVGNRDKVETDEKNGDSSGANFPNLSMGMVPDGNTIAVCKGDLISPSLSSMVDSFGPSFWEHPANSQSLGFNSINAHSAGWEARNSMLKGGMFMSSGSGAGPHSLSQFPADSAFIDRAARFSSFNMGNISDMINPVGMNQTVDHYHQVAMIPQEPDEVFAGNAPSTSKDDTKQAGSDEMNTAPSVSQEEPSLTDSGAEPSSAKGLGSKKRRRVGEDTGPEQSHQQSGEDDKNNGKQNSPAPPSNKANGKNGKQSSQASDPAKEDYIHVRARRGQATNSHSLAERVRREKISERMKFLQDLVPGCSKVTGKAVMLDEIINYVQSLQRQVEFLSMKLATVNPTLDCSIESLLAKEQMFVGRASPSTLGLSPEMPMVYPPLHTSQTTVIQPGLPVIGSSSAVLRNINSQLTSINEGFKEPTPQMHNLWDEELHNVVQMGFNPNHSPDNQDTNSSLPPGHMKVEL